MTSTALRTTLVAAMLVLAGCAGGVPGAGPTDATAPADDRAGTDGGTPTAGQVQFYLSDQPNAIEDFEHLNVTVTSVGFHRVGDGATDSTAAGTATTASNVTTDDANGTTDGTGESERDDDGEDDERERADGDGEWVTYEVPNATVDLTRLVGANATRLAEFGVPAGEYDAVFVHVSEVNGTLAGGEDVRVKLPSGKLQLHSQFRVEANGSVDFVYDVAVHRAGRSGKYVLRPVVSESGADQEFEDVDEREAGDDEREDGGEGRERDDEPEPDDRGASLNATLRGNVTPGDDVTLAVTRNGSAVADAGVEVNGERAGRTGADGTLTFAVPRADELEVAVRVGDAEVELEHEFDDGRPDEGRGNGS